MKEAKYPNSRLSRCLEMSVALLLPSSTSSLNWLEPHMSQNQIIMQNYSFKKCENKKSFIKN